MKLLFQYIRLSHNDSVDRCLELMDKHWKIMEPKRPSLCISVIGGAKSFKLDNKMRETFNTGLIKVYYIILHLFPLFLILLLFLIVGLLYC